MINDNRPGDSRISSPPLINPDEYPLTDDDRNELRFRHGLSDETIGHCRFGSIRDQEQLDALGIEWGLDELPSRIVIPYLATADEHGCFLYRLHQRTLPDIRMPLYVLEHPAPKEIILVENELRTAAAWQLGYTALGLQGIHSHIHRVNEIIETLKMLEKTK